MFNRLWIRIALTFALVQMAFMALPIGVFIALTQFDIVDPPTMQEEFAVVFADLDLSEEQQMEIARNIIQETRFNFPREFLQITILSGIVGSIAGFIVSRRLTRPLNDLEQGAQSINLRQLDVHIDDTKGGTEVEAVAKAFNNMTARLRHSETVRKNLLADVAHELRTPLTVVQGNLRAMLDGVYPMNEEEIAGIFDQTQHLTRLVEDLHELANAEADQLSLNFEEVNIAELVQACTSAFRPLIEEQGVSLRPELLGKLPIIHADRTRLAQAINNLINNAIRYTPVEGTITVQTGQVDGAIEIRVRDTGVGIEPQHLPHVFDRFYRIDGSRQRHEDASGSGLGLAIARAVVEAHGGSMTVESGGINRGSQFMMKLPISSLSN